MIKISLTREKNRETGAFGNTGFDNNNKLMRIISPIISVQLFQITILINNINF
jgi:hypothetical protein